MGLRPLKRSEVVDEVRLIGITVGEGEVDPVYFGLRLMLDRVNHVLETLNTAEEFWCQSHLISKQFDETSLAEIDLSSDLFAGEESRIALKSS